MENKRIIRATDEVKSKVYFDNGKIPTINFSSASTLVVSRLLLPNSDIYFSSVYKIEFTDKVIQIHIHDEYNIHYVNIEDSNIVLDWNKGAYVLSIEPANINDDKAPVSYRELNETSCAKNYRVYTRLKPDGLLTYFTTIRGDIDGAYDEDRVKKLEGLQYPIKENNYLLYHKGTKYQILKIKQTPQTYLKEESTKLYTECVYDTFDESRVSSISNCGLEYRISSNDIYTFDERTIFVDTVNNNNIIKAFDDYVDETLISTYTSDEIRNLFMNFVQSFITATSVEDRKKCLDEFCFNYKGTREFFFGNGIEEGIDIVYLAENEIFDAKKTIKYYKILTDVGIAIKDDIDRNIDQIKFEFNQ